MQYKSEYCEQLIEHMGMGLTFDAFAGRIGATCAEITAWTLQHEEFERARLVGWAKGLLHHELVGLELARNGDSSVWKKQMQQLYKWTDKEVIAVAHFDAYKQKQYNFDEIKQIMNNDEFMDWFKKTGGDNGIREVVGSTTNASEGNGSKDPLA